MDENAYYVVSVCLFESIHISIRWLACITECSCGVFDGWHVLHCAVV